VNLPPFEGRYKVFIIDGLEFLSIAAANRMLKTLEEPVGNVIFILLTVNEAMVPATVISRCQRIELFPLALSLIEKALMTRWNVEPEKAKLLSRLSAGCPGWAVAMSKDNALLQQRNDCLDEWLEVIESDFDRRFTFVSKMTERYTQNREIVQQKLALLLDWWRDVLLTKVGNEEAIINIDRENGLKETAATCNLAQIRQFISTVESTMSHLRQNVNPQLALEVLMLNVPERGKVKKTTL
jgi:DNA polymerase-3 subunit delta'